MKLKPILLTALTAALCCLSCQMKEDLAVEGEERLINISAGLPSELHLKSNTDPGNGSEINRCILEIYENGALYGERHYAEVSNLHADFSVRLISGRTYKFVFWADYAGGNMTDGFEDAFYNTADGLNAISIKEFANNDDRMDAFFGAFDTDITSSSLPAFTLKRPFGQVNLFTLDLKEIPSSVSLENITAKVSYTNAPTTFNAIDGAVSNPSNLTPGTFTAPVSLSADAEKAQISFDYIFASPEAEQTSVDFTLELNQQDSKFCEPFQASDIPVRRNHKTNVSANFLTTGTDIDVDIEPDDTETGGEVEDIQKTLYIYGEAVYVTDCTKAISMDTDNAGTFTWTGWLEPEKGFRFITGLSDWPAYVKGEGENAIEYCESDPGDDSDQNFTYTGEAAGWKEITVDTRNLTISITDAKGGEPVPGMLVIGGTALDPAWDFESGNRSMTRTATGFTWTGDMIRGTFRFAAQNEYWPGYKRNWKSEDYWTITPLNDNYIWYDDYGTEYYEDDLYDVGFTVLKTGKYTVTVDFLTYKVNLELVEEHETTYEENLYILFASEWDNDPVRTEMKKESEGIFSWEGFVTVGGHDKIADGEFQIFTSPEPGNWWPRYTLTYTNDPDYKNRIDLYSYDPTMSIDIKESGKYRIVINLVEMTYEVTRTE